MPRTKPVKRIRVLRVDTETHKCSGRFVRCSVCRYEGAADVVSLRSRRNGHRSLERCPSCKSLNIICEEKNIVAKHWKTDEWENCYPSQWRGMIVPEAMKHPAKFSSRLIRRIYDHFFEEDWLAQGDRVLDPFGGVALGALHAMEFGLQWVGNELEPKFVDVGKANIARWNNRFSSLPHWGEAALLQGDSRKLAYELALKGTETGFRARLSSPPYKNATQGAGLNVERPETFRGVLKEGSLAMGNSPWNLGAMDDRNFRAAISSPPFRHSEGGTPEPKPGGVIDERLYARHAAGNSAAEGYGKTDGQLGNMPEGELEKATGWQEADKENPDDFWLAARLIVEQVYSLLEAGGHACWVVKDFVRDRERVAFSDQWRKLCEAVGFVTLHEHQATLVHRRGVSLTLEGERVEHKTESKSFFRRVAEKKGSPRVDWEVVWCMEKPL